MSTERDQIFRNINISLNKRLRKAIDKNDSDPLRARRPELAKVLSHPPLSHPSRIILCCDVIAKSSFIVWRENGHVDKTVGLTKTGSEKLRRVNRPDASSLDGRNNEVCPALTFFAELVAGWTLGGNVRAAATDATASRIAVTSGSE